MAGGSRCLEQRSFALLLLANRSDDVFGRPGDHRTTRGAHVRDSHPGRAVRWHRGSRCLLRAPIRLDGTVDDTLRTGRGGRGGRAGGGEITPKNTDRMKRGPADDFGRAFSVDRLCALREKNSWLMFHISLNWSIAFG